jgi:hypothetical protein
VLKEADNMHIRVQNKLSDFLVQAFYCSSIFLPTVSYPAGVTRFAKSKISVLLAYVMCSINISAIAETSSIEEVILVENGTNLTLLSDGTCRSNSADIVSLPEENNNWKTIVNTPYINKLSGLAILEEVKQQVRRTRIVMAVDSDNETLLTIRHANKTRKISLYSVDIMHHTYPDAELLGHFIELVTYIRSTESYCQ